MPVFDGDFLGVVVAAGDHPPIGAAGADFRGVRPEVDVEYGGASAIAGTTEVQTGAGTFQTVGYCIVNLHDRRGGALIRQTISDAAGQYVFENLAAWVAGRAYAVAFDSAGQYDSATTRSLANA